VWFVGVTPRRNPELVICVLWQNGDKSYYPARIGAEVVSAYVAKQRRLAKNLVPSKTPAPFEMGAMWTSPNPNAVSGNKTGSTDQVQTGNFMVQNGKIVAQSKPKTVTGNPAAPNKGPAAVGRGGLTPSQSKPRQAPAAPARQEEANLPASRKGE